MTLKTDINLSVRTSQKGTPDGGSTLSELVFSFSQSLSDGITAGKANVPWRDDRQIASAGNESLDFAGSLVDALGNPAVFAKIKLLALKAKSTNTTDLTVGNGTNPFVGPLVDATKGVILKPGDVQIWYSAAGWAVGAGASDVLKLANGSGAAADYEIFAIGTNA